MINEEEPITFRIDLRTARITPPAVEEGPVFDVHEPEGPVEDKWAHFVSTTGLTSPADRPKLRIAVVGTGLVGAGAAVSLLELGFAVDAVTFHDSPRRAHLVVAQGGINAARGRGVDGDSLKRFVTDALEGGDFRARESEVHRLGELSSKVTDHMNALGVPFACEYGGHLAKRSFGGTQVSWIFHSRGQTGQQLQIATSSAFLREAIVGRIRLRAHTGMLDLLLAEGRAAGVVVRDLESGRIHVIRTHAIVLATGGHGNHYFSSILAKNPNVTAAWRTHRVGVASTLPPFAQFHPTALLMSNPWQLKTTPMSEPLRNDGRIWVSPSAQDQRGPDDIPEGEWDYYLERQYPVYGNPTSRDIASRATHAQIRTGCEVGPARNSVYLGFRDALIVQGRQALEVRYSNLFDMYKDLTGGDPYTRPMRIAPGAHFIMGGPWVDYRLQSTIPGLSVADEADAAYHGANRLGMNSFLATCVDGAFTIPYVVTDYLSTRSKEPLISAEDSTLRETLEWIEKRIDRAFSVVGTTSAKDFHRELGKLMYESCGVTRSRKGLIRGIYDIRQIRTVFDEDVRITGTTHEFNQDPVEAMRVWDLLEFAELMRTDALHREESCGAHFRVERVTADGEVRRDDEEWRCTSAWKSQGWDQTPSFPYRHEDLAFYNVEVKAKDYR